MNLFITEWANSPRPRGRKNSHAFVSDRIELKSLKAQPRALSEKKKKTERGNQPEIEVRGPSQILHRSSL